MAKEKRTSVYFDREKLQFVGLDAATKKQLKKTYADIDVEKELGKMELWLASDRGKRRTGNLAFIVNWLSNAIAGPTVAQNEPERISPVIELLTDYLKDLWKNREHILDLNTMKR